MNGFVSLDGLHGKVSKYVHYTVNSDCKVLFIVYISSNTLAVVYITRHVGYDVSIYMYNKWLYTLRLCHASYTWTIVHLL